MPRESRWGAVVERLRTSPMDTPVPVDISSEDDKKALRSSLRYYGVKLLFVRSLQGWSVVVTGREVGCGRS